MAPSPERILVIHLAGIGDLLMGRQALQALRAAFPASRIALLTFANAGELARLIPSVDERYSLEEEYSWRAVQRNLATIFSLRRRRFDLAVNLYQVYRSIGVVKLAILLRLIAARRTAGRDTDGRGACFDQRIPERSAEKRHEVERQCAFVERLGCPVPAGPVPLVVDPDDQQAIERWLGAHGLPEDATLVAIHPGGARLGHRWPAPAFAALARTLQRRYGVAIVLTGNREERRLVEDIAKSVTRPLVAAGELPFGQLAALLRRCRLCITNDSGPMHLAAALQVPMVAILGPTDPRRYGPYPLDRPDQRILHAVPCAPCYHNRCGGHEALERLPVQAVLDAAQAILESQHPVGLTEVPQRPRVLHVHTLPVISGSGLNTFSSMCGQRDAGYAVELACAPSFDDARSPRLAQEGGAPSQDESLIDLARSDGIPVREIPHLRRRIHPWDDLCALLELWRLMRRGRYALVHTHNSKAGILGRLAARWAGVPVVIHTYHSCVFRYPHLRPWQQRVFLWTERLAARWTDYFVAISEGLRREFLDAGIAPPDRIAVVYSGIDVAQFQQPVALNGYRTALGLQSDDLVLGSVARLDVGKGHQELFEAVVRLRPRFPRLHVLCVGDGPLRSRLTEQLRRLRLTDCIHLLGERRDVPQLTQLFDVAVLASDYEGMGRVLLEAQAAGKPVVATKAGGIPDVVKDGETGYLVPVGDTQALAKALERLLADAFLRQKMGRAALEWIGERFSSQRMCEQLQALYRRLLKDGGPC